jgi:hypothetical protein
MSQKDPWRSAVICAKAALTTKDPHKRAILPHLGEFWLALARHDISQFREDIAIEIAIIVRMQPEIPGEAAAIH